MKEHSPRLTKPRAINIFNYWAKVYGVTGWRLRLKFVSQKELFAMFGDKIGDAGINFIADTREAIVYVLMNTTEEEFNLNICHEFGHLICDPIDEAFKMVCEKYGVIQEDIDVMDTAQENVINAFRNIIINNVEGV